jgi:hypothetical protein
VDRDAADPTSGLTSADEEEDTTVLSGPSAVGSSGSATAAGGVAAEDTSAPGAPVSVDAVAGAARGGWVEWAVPAAISGSRTAAPPSAADVEPPSGADVEDPLGSSATGTTETAGSSGDAAPVGVAGDDWSGTEVGEGGPSWAEPASSPCDGSRVASAS